MDSKVRLPGGPPTIPRMNAALPWIRPFLTERITLIANHLLASEPVAVQRLRRHEGRSVAVQVQLRLRLPFQSAEGSMTPGLRWVVTPAGLLELHPADVPEPDGLTVDIDMQGPFEALTTMLSGQRPPMSIQGDAQFAADVAWVIDNLRWDAEDDLARVVGGPQAHLAMQWLLSARAALLGLAGWARAGAANGQGANAR